MDMVREFPFWLAFWMEFGNHDIRLLLHLQDL